MNFKVIGVAVVLALAGISPSQAQEQENNFPQPDGDVVCEEDCSASQTWDLVGCTLTTCTYYVCTTITMAGTSCSYVWRPRPPIRPGYPEEP